MTPSDSSRLFQAWLADRSISLQGLSIPALVDAVLAFYESVLCSGLSSGPDSDMLLYQWGVYNWGEGEHFEFDLTRQFIEQDDDGISQLHITAYFEPTDELRRVAPGNQWCEHVAKVNDLRQFIEASPAYRAVMGQGPQRVAVAWSLV
ncbi:MAG TPA: hypothetical protein VFO36_06760 [Nitrospiraceae bacterium]|nr:hypothetical protein [Nitrospiraceae bacterium]